MDIYRLLSHFVTTHMTAWIWIATITMEIVQLQLALSITPNTFPSELLPHLPNYEICIGLEI